jgi:hypothetical protein
VSDVAEQIQEPLDKLKEFASMIKNLKDGGVDVKRFQKMLESLQGSKKHTKAKLASLESSLKDAENLVKLVKEIKKTARPPITSEKIELFKGVAGVLAGKVGSGDAKVGDVIRQILVLVRAESAYATAVQQPAAERKPELEALIQKAIETLGNRSEPLSEGDLALLEQQAASFVPAKDPPKPAKH